MKANIGRLFFQLVEKFEFEDSNGRSLRECPEVIEFFESIAPKQKRQYIDVNGILNFFQNPTRREDIKFAVNKEDYEMLAQKEGQSYIWEDDSIKYMQNIKSLLVKIPGLKKSYIIKPLF